MMQFAVPVGNFVNTHPSIQILGLSFLILIGFMLITEGYAFTDALVFGSHVTPVLKVHFYHIVLILVEVLNEDQQEKQ
jgi:predicted tellurium resistance membrane protein TerC